MQPRLASNSPSSGATPPGDGWVLSVLREEAGWPQTFLVLPLGSWVLHFHATFWQKSLKFLVTHTFLFFFLWRVIMSCFARRKKKMIENKTGFSENVSCSTSVAGELQFFPEAGLMSGRLL
jgi:hypothetical protein